MKRIQPFAVLMGVLLVSLFTVMPASAAGPSQWSISSTKVPQTIYDISCPSTTLCVAADWDGDLSVSTDPTGGAGTWHEVPIPQVSIPHMMAVDCPSTTLCVAVGTFNTMAISTNPTGGAAAWDIVPMSNGLVVLQTVDCPSVSLCVAFDGEGNVLTSTNPAGGTGAWTESKNTMIPVRIPWNYSLDCPSTSLCVVGREDGMSTTTNPTGGTGAWNFVEFWPHGSNNYPYNVLCPSTTLCLASEGEGNLLTSTNPTGGAGAWSGFNVRSGSDGRFAVTCPSTSFCVGFDNEGGMLTSENPAAGESSWSRTPLPKPLADVWVAPQLAGLLVWQVSCPSVTFCVGLAADGTNEGTYVVTGTTPGSDPGPSDGGSSGGTVPGSNPGAGSGSISRPLPGVVDRCTVPYLKGQSLRSAKRMLKRSNCRLGTVSRSKAKRHQKHQKRKKRLTVRGQSPKPGSTKPVGTKVSVRLA